MEEENKLEIIRNLLEGRANRRDRDESGDIEEERKNNDRKDMGEGEKQRRSVEGPLLENKNICA